MVRHVASHIRRAAVLVSVFLSCVSGPAALLPAAASSARTADGGHNCYKMLVLRVVDGDTVYGYIDTSDPIVAVRVKLRLKGIDAPEHPRPGKMPGRTPQGRGSTALCQHAPGPRHREPHPKPR